MKWFYFYLIILVILLIAAIILLVVICRIGKNYLETFIKLIDLLKGGSLL